MQEDKKYAAETGVTLKFDVGGLSKSGKRKTCSGSNPGENRVPGRVPRIARLMALAIHLQKLINNGVVRDYAEIARLTGLTRARITQIMNLTLLAPRIQEEILFLPRTVKGHDPIAERNVRKIATETYWSNQNSLWKEFNLHLSEVQR